MKTSKQFFDGAQQELGALPIEAAYTPPPPSGSSVLWVKISGIWKQTTPWIKISGVWKQATPYIKISGIWK